MKFTKMHGIGNDYVYVNCFKEEVACPGETAKYVSDRHFGVGSDGLILIKPSEKADVEMAMYNADGSRGEMCGNGIRCVAKYVYDYGLTDKTGAFSCPRKRFRCFLKAIMNRRKNRARQRRRPFMSLWK